MKIAELRQRFEFYAQTHLAIKHDPDNKKESAFKFFDLENLLSANRTGLKFPCLFLKTPDVTKQGGHDSLFEALDCSFFVVMPVRKGDDEGKAAAFDVCKGICDDIYNRIYADSSGLFDGLDAETSEGEVGPVVDNCFGWGVTLTIDKGYNAELNTEMWEDLR